MVSGVDQLFIRWYNNYEIILIMSKDDLLMVGKRNQLEYFVDLVGRRFPISKTVIDYNIRFIGCTILREDNGDILMSMKDYLDSI